MAYDWMEDDTMSTEETLKRFAALKPQPTRGPRAHEIIEAWSGMHIVTRCAAGVSTASSLHPTFEPAKVAALAR